MNQGVSSETADRLTEFAMNRYPDVQAIVLVGSQARGTATAFSDFDLICLGDGPEYELDVFDVGIVAFQFGSKERHRSLMFDPSQCAQVVPAWRDAVILFDPRGDAAFLQDQAMRWDWEDVFGSVQLWATERVVGLAEELMKMLAALDSGAIAMARVQASLLAIHLTPLMNTVARHLYKSENELWSDSSQNPPWHELLSIAVGATDISPIRSCEAALDMYAQAVEMTEAWMDVRQRSVCAFVQHRIKRVSKS